MVKATVAGVEGVGVCSPCVSLLCPLKTKSNFSDFGQKPWTIYKLDTETEGSTRFRNPRARGCSVPSAARALLRARGFLNAWIPLVEVSKYF